MSAWWQAMVRRAIKPGVVIRYDLRIILKDSSERWAHPGPFVPSPGVDTAAQHEGHS